MLAAAVLVATGFAMQPTSIILQPRPCATAHATIRSSKATLAAAPEVQVAFGLTTLLSVFHGLLPQPPWVEKDTNGMITQQPNAPKGRSRTTKLRLCAEPDPRLVRPDGGVPPGLPPHLQTMAEELASGEAQLFDVREPREATMGKLTASILVPLSELQEGLPPSKKTADPTKLTYLHCAAGIRVHPSKEMLETFGYERVVALQEGFATLANMGFELED